LRRPAAFCEAHYETYANEEQTRKHVTTTRRRRNTLATSGVRSRNDEWEYNALKHGTSVNPYPANVENRVSS
jgi:hypothetical protein